MGHPKNQNPGLSLTLHHHMLIFLGDLFRANALVPTGSSGSLLQIAVRQQLELVMRYHLGG
jgi:hypothetical protein